MNDEVHDGGVDGEKRGRGLSVRCELNVKGLKKIPEGSGETLGRERSPEGMR